MAKAKKTGYYSLNKNFIARDIESSHVYEYSLESAQKLAMWARMLPTTPEDRGPNNLSPVYENTPSFSEVNLGNKIYPAAQFNDIGTSTSAYVTSTSGFLSFSSLASGGVPTATSDQPFSISLWLNKDILSGTKWIFGKKSGSSYEYGASITTGGMLIFELNDINASGATEVVYTAAASIATKTWYHLTFTYDGRGTTDARNGMQIYINGQLSSVTRSNSGTYVGMQPDYTEPLYIGGSYDGTKEVGGWLSEFVVWSKELTADEVAAVYYGTEYGSNELISGFLNNPPRILLQDNDNRTGSYPSVARTGDPDFLGKRKIFYNDQQTVEYFSAYPEAEIEILGVPPDAGTIGLTGSNSVKITYEFQRGTLKRYADSTIIDITGKQNARSVARILAKTINDSALGIEGRSHGETVKLRSHTPGEWSASDLITSSTLYRGLDLKVTQFNTHHRPQNYNYPLLLPDPTKGDYYSGSTHVQALVATPNITGSLSGPAIMSPGISGPGIHFTPGENLSPFNDSRVRIVDSAFYATGTSPSVMEGFSEKLSSKTSIVIPLPSSQETKLAFSTGSNSGIAHNQGRVAERIADASLSITLDASNCDVYYQLMFYADVGDGANSLVDWWLFDNSKTAMSGADAMPLRTGRCPYKGGGYFAEGGYSEGNWINVATYAEAAQNLAQLITSYSPYTDAAAVGPTVYVWNHIPLAVASQNGNTGLIVLDDGGFTVTTINWANQQSAPSVIEPIQSGLVYYNFAKSKWEPHDNRSQVKIFSGSKVDYITNTPTQLSASTLAVVPAAYWDASISGIDLGPSNIVCGTPTDIAGFPLASQFDATGSQLLDMSHHITAPFLVEKMVLNVSGAFGGMAAVDGVEQPFLTTFMVLLQRDLNFTGSIDPPQEWALYDNDTGEITTKKGDPANYTKDKRIIWTGRVGRYFVSDLGASYAYPTEEALALARPGFYSAAEKWLPMPGVYSTKATAFTGSIFIENECRSPSEALRTTYPVTHNRGAQYTSNLPIFGRSRGGRNLFDLSDGRSFIRTYPGNKKIKQIDTSLAQSNTKPWAPGMPQPDGTKHLDVPVWEKESLVSPFLLLPGDKIFLMAAQQQWDRLDDNVDGTNSLAGRYATKIAAHPGSLTMFGTHVREDRSVQFELNQPLTSDALHEDIRDDLSPFGEARCLDQWKVEPRSSYYGSYLDNVITGSMTDPRQLDKYVWPFTTNVRSRQSSAVDETTAGNPYGYVYFGDASVSAKVTALKRKKMHMPNITGSMQRFVRVGDKSQTYYDSTAPSLISYVNKYQMYRDIDQPLLGGDAIYLVSHEMDMNREPTAIAHPIYNPSTLLVTGNVEWCASYPFEKMSGIPRIITPAASMRESGVDGTAIDTIGLISSGVIGSIGTPGADVANKAGWGTQWPQPGNKEIALGSAVPGQGDKLRLLGSGSIVFMTSLGEKASYYTSAADYWFGKSTFGLGGPSMIMKLFFGFGDWHGLPFDYSAAQTLNWIGQPSGSHAYVRATYREVTNTGSNDYGVLLRGWKYGLYSGLPTHPSAVWRSDTYGQFRDRLEQPLMSRFYNDGRLGEPIVNIQFFNRAGDPGVDPETTNSQNLSKFATSSMPYYDNVAKDRPSIQPDLLDKITVG